MYLNSARLIPAFSNLYCGIFLYLANSAAQSADDNGGTMPVTGRHSVIDSPDRVRRVIPPITTIRKIIAQQPNSHTATGRRRCAGTAMSRGAGSARAVGM